MSARKRKTDTGDNLSSIKSSKTDSTKSKYFEGNESSVVGIKCKTKSEASNNVLTTSVMGHGDAYIGQYNNRLDGKFYDKPCDDLAKALLGKLLVRKLPTGERLSGMIVETEAYLGREDKAAHSYKGKTDRNEAMFMDPGAAYVYNIYGMYCCMNISSRGEGCAVLLRSLEPVDGKQLMESKRSSGKKDKTKKLKQKEFCNGPSKLCQSLQISKNDINKQDMTSSGEIWLEDYQSISDDAVVTSKRININYAEEWIDKPLRFYILGNDCVSVRDKEAEKTLKT